jgi:hypothetical protein
MNRSARRKARAEGRLARDAKPEEIFPDDRHGPIQPEAYDTMNKVAHALKAIFGDNYDITLFVAERQPPAGQDRAPRFNYISTAAREDMVAVLEAFVAKHKGAWLKLDKIADEPPTGRAQ